MKISQIITESSTKNIQQELSNKYGVKLGLYDNDHLVELSKIIIPKEKRGQGIGTKVMKELLVWADDNEKTITLTPSSDLGGNKAKLQKFYKSLGFVDNRGSNKDYEISDTMYRTPDW